MRTWLRHNGLRDCADAVAIIAAGLAEAAADLIRAIDRRR